MMRHKTENWRILEIPAFTLKMDNFTHSHIHTFFQETKEIIFEGKLFASQTCIFTPVTIKAMKTKLTKS